jgi:hypothetical protein
MLFNLETILIFYFILTSLNYLIIQFPNFLRGRKSYIRNDLTSTEVLQALKRKDFPKFSIQITTKGSEMLVIKEGLEAIEVIYQTLPKQIAQLISVDLLSENATDVKYLQKTQMSFAFNFHLVPKEYQTPKVIFQGPIFYPYYWSYASAISKQMESLRPWNCYECQSNTNHNYPFHLHGSNLVVRTDIERLIGWDFGLLHGYPLVAEDLLFGLKAFLLMGKSAFAWHGGLLLEQPGFSISDSIKQRIRWVKGGLQAQSLVRTWPEFQAKPRSVRIKILRKLWFKIIVYAAGFIPAVISIILLAYFIISSLITFGMSVSFDSFKNSGYLFTDIPWYLILILIVGLLLWLLSIQIGAYHNLNKTNLGLLQKMKDHLVILLITPFATLLETGAVLITILSWLFGQESLPKIL